MEPLIIILLIKSLAKKSSKGCYKILKKKNQKSTYKWLPTWQYLRRERDKNPKAGFYFLRPSISRRFVLVTNPHQSILSESFLIMLSHHYQSSIVSVLFSTIIGSIHTISIITVANWFWLPASVTFSYTTVVIKEVLVNIFLVCFERWLLWKVMDCVLWILHYNSPVQSYPMATRGSFS